MKDLADFPDAHLRIFERPAAPDPAQVDDIYLVGICGTGMGSLAGLFTEAGYAVRGSDQAAYPPMSTRLAATGVTIYEGYDAAHLDPPPGLVIVGNACTPTHPEAAYARTQGLVQQSFPEALAHFFLRDRRALVVAGTHGKTTTTALLLHVLRAAGCDPGYLVGGVLADGSESTHVGTGPYFVVEGDEYDSAYFDKRPKFMHYGPASAIVTSMEFDHADIYEHWDDYREAFEAFAGLVPPEGVLALCIDDPAVRALAAHTSAQVRTYGLADDAQVTAHHIAPRDGGQHFVLVVDGRPVAPLFLPMSGRHNLQNALGVCAIALHEGLKPAEIAAGFTSFKGIKRRQEVRGEAGGVIVVDDFAHHPTAVQATIRAVAERWPDRRVVAVFEPRSNSSRRKVFEAAYGEAFDEASAAFFSMPPFRHNDQRADFMDIDILTADITRRGTPAKAFEDHDTLLAALCTTLRPGDVALVMSNGSFGGLHQRLLDALATEVTT